MTAARRLTFRIAFRVMQVWWFVRRPHTRGVKLILRRGNDVLFVRHTYGSRGRWDLPGGGRKSDETPVDTARREAFEELGVRVDDWECAGEFVFTEHATAHLSCMTAVYDAGPIRINRGELAQAMWAPLNRPPTPLSDLAARSLAELAGPAAPSS